MSAILSNDKRLKQSVIDKDIDTLEEILQTGLCTPAGVNEALYCAATLGMDDYSNILVHDDNYRTHYVTGTLNYACAVGDHDLISECLDSGADIHQDNEMPLRCAVKGLQKETIVLLLTMDCNINIAFPKEEIEALWKKRDEGIQANKVLKLISELKADAGGGNVRAFTGPNFDF